MTGMGPAEIRVAVARANAAIGRLEQELNDADSRLGDGDTGGMLSRVLASLAKADLTPEGDVGALFLACAKAASSATGSSLGTLLSTGLLSIGKATRGRAEVPWGELGQLLRTAGEAMSARGGASLGDKTVLDAIEAVASAIAGLDDPGRQAQAATAAGHDALERFRGRPNRVGRARMFADASAGLDDPGMLAFVRLTEAIASR